MGMKTLLTLLLIGMSTTVFAQQSRVWVAPSYLPKGALKDSIKAKQFKEEQKKQAAILQLLQGKPAPINNNMPNAIRDTPPPVYNGNNGQGFDVYRSQVDNMPILMPDSLNAASLKMKGDAKTYPSIFIQPKIVSPIPKK
jgi:hypothetical protein